jgi:hypothetical protein
MANIPAATNASAAGINITTPPTAALTNMSFANDGRTMLRVKTVATGANLTLTPQGKVQDGSPAGLLPVAPVIVLATNQEYLIGPFSPGVYNDANGEMNIVFSAVTAIVLQAIRVNQAAA